MPACLIVLFRKSLGVAHAGVQHVCDSETAAFPKHPEVWPARKYNCLSNNCVDFAEQFAITSDRTRNRLANMAVQLLRQSVKPKISFGSRISSAEVRGMLTY